MIRGKNMTRKNLIYDIVICGRLRKSVEDILNRKRTYKMLELNIEEICKDT